jgi:hypothetical protein
MKRIALVALAAMLTIGSFANGEKQHIKKQAKHAKKECTNCTKTQCSPACQPQCHQMACNKS